MSVRPIAIISQYIQMLTIFCSLESDIMLYVDYASVKQRHNCGKGCLAASCAQENPSLGTIGGVPDDPEA